MTDTTLETKTVTKTVTVSMWNVVFLNDNFTPMDFVIQVLVELYGKTDRDAYNLTMAVHRDGRAVVATYPEEIAKQKVKETMHAAQRFQHPLKVVPEEA